LVTEPTLDDAADYRFDNLYRVNWIEKLPDYQYQCFYLRFHQIYDTFGGKSCQWTASLPRLFAAFDGKSGAKPSACRFRGNDIWLC
jgi:hypothetical protein